MVDQLGNWRPDFPGQQPWMDPQFVRLYGQQQQQAAQQNAPQQQSAPAAMTPPTIHAEIIQVDSEQAATQYPVGAGASQMMMSRDESAIFVKTGTANGYTLDVYDRRPPAPTPPPFDPSKYMLREEVPGLVAAEVQAALAAAMPSKPARTKKETEAAE